MQVGDLVDDGFDNIGIIVALGWLYPVGECQQQTYHVHFPNKSVHYSGWYEICDLKKVSPQEEAICK